MPEGWRWGRTPGRYCQVLVLLPIHPICHIRLWAALWLFGWTCTLAPSPGFGSDRAKTEGCKTAIEKSFARLPGHDSCRRRWCCCCLQGRRVSLSPSRLISWMGWKKGIISKTQPTWSTAMNDAPYDRRWFRFATAHRMASSQANSAHSVEWRRSCLRFINWSYFCADKRRARPEPAQQTAQQHSNNVGPILKCMIRISFVRDNHAGAC